MDQRLFEHGPVPLPACVKSDYCQADYITALKLWGEGLAGKLDKVRESLGGKAKTTMGAPQ